VAIAFPVAFATSAGIGWVVNTFLGTGGFLLILLFAVGPGIAELIVRAVERTTRMKRGRAMQITVGLAIVLGALAAWLLRPIFPPLALLLFTILAVSTAATRLR
jgi:hypothetical protein